MDDTKLELINTNRKKIAFVCQRYGTDVNGGSEQYCRQIAERLAGEYSVTVYTTCAKDYVTWRNHFQSGAETINGVTVKRYEVSKPRNRYVSALAARLLRLFPHSEKAEWKWIDLQGPYCPQLTEAVKREATAYQAVLFMTYLYYTTARGLLADLPNAVLIPTLHNEPPVWFRCYDTVFTKPGAFVWLTPEEREFAHKRFPQIREKPDVLTGIGIEEAPAAANEDIPPEIRDCPYFLYVGRIAEAKGCGEMIRFFRKLKKENPGNLKLVLIGNPVMTIPKDPDIICLGFVDEKTKATVMANATALVLHSQYESLSMVVLESMAHGTPVLVNGKCAVLRGHCRRSGAGLCFETEEEYNEAVSVLLNDKKRYDKMSRNGKQYVAKNYRWDIILEKYRQIIGSAMTKTEGTEQT